MQIKPLKIAMIIDVYEPVRNGAVTSTARFASGLRDLGHEVTIISSAESSATQIQVPKFYLPYVEKKYMQPMEMVFAKPNRKLLTKLLPQFDCVHIHLPFFLGNTATKVANKLNIPCIATHHIQAEQVANAGITWQWIITLFYKLFLKTYNRCDFLVCPSQMGLDDIRRYGLKVPAEVISNGVSASFKPAPAMERLEWKDKFVIISVGRLAVEKAHDVTIKAIAKSRFKDKIQLVIAGTGAQRDNLEKLAASLSVAIEFMFLGQADLIKLYNSADLFVHSSYAEMEGMVCSEAIACGVVPIIADNKLSASKQFALDNRSVYKFGDADLLAQKIDAWLEDPSQLQQMQDAYVEHSKKWSFANSLSKLEQIYYKVVADKIGV